MRNFLFGLSVLGVFCVGGVGTMFVVRPGSGSLMSTVVPAANCNTADPVCRNRHRGRAYLLIKAGQAAEAREAFRTAALAGDERSQFQLGWLHEQAYRAKVGRAMATTIAVDEERFHGAEGLPKGEAFLAMVRRHTGNADPHGPVLAERTLAFLWYSAAAQAGFAPAMNNLASMYQFGMLGRIDRVKAREWYIRAYDRGNPVAAYNLERLNNLDAPELHDCRYDGRWLPLVLKPKPEDLLEPIFTQTRFRGRELDPGMKELIRSQVRAVGAGALAAEAEAEPPGLIQALLDEVRYGRPITVYDDETPEEAKTIPEWKGAANPSGSSKIAPCDSARLDERLKRVEAAAMKDLDLER